MKHDKLAALIILDGLGLREEVQGNAVKQAYTPNLDRYWHTYPHNQLEASGEAVGLPDGQMGNSEVGHLNIGAGRIVYQSLSRVNLSIQQGDFFEREAFLNAIQHAKDHQKALHIFGLLSDGGVHSHIDHLFALLKLSAEHKLQDVYIHAFLDGRDVGQKTAKKYIEQAQDKMYEYGVGRFATISGRYYAMDRDKRWDRVQKVYDAMVYSKGQHYKDPIALVNDSYEKGIFDEFIMPTVITDEHNEPVSQIEDDDSIIFYNFRPDRAIQLSRTFANDNFQDFDRGKQRPKRIHFVMLTEFSEAIDGYVAYETLNLSNTIGEVLSQNNINQLRIAETEKYPHVTFFMSGGRENEFSGEKRQLIDSPNVGTYDLQPEMSIYDVTDSLLEELESQQQNAIILNFANPDMVGHSGKLEPTIKAVEAVDECLGKVVDKISELGGYAIITADHGNSDEVITLEGSPMTTHTTRPVPVIVTNERAELRDEGILADLAPTLLDLLDIDKPDEMSGRSLIL